ncbi:DNA-directed RNA polymerases I and III subunit RPAC1 [Caerostris darwini]|uniref:DNA-directed RNA polymerases I and III subunit RPAC1 n=1 Tax=Caerostris darwini TaxID=1538125 RepID=A0AAV4VTG7_9ARAC|nr:DNA-directed RNA polymerases I and III subunit RPAC1 [Caerostris darwini]
MKTDPDVKTYKLDQFSVSTGEFEGSEYGKNLPTVKELIEGFQIQIISVNELNKDIEFDMKGVGPPIANAIRRILLSEIPTMAIDKIELYNNTTVIPDEVLTHRIGLIPINANPHCFISKSSDDDNATFEDTIQFELKVKCEKAPSRAYADDNQTEKLIHEKVMSGDLKFVPIGGQKEWYGDIRPVYEDILISRMKKGQEIELKAFCYKNIGREHAKFSPVAIASYRLHPQLRLLKEISGERAYELAKCFPDGVIKISKKNGKEIAEVGDARKIRCSRNVLRNDDLKNDVEICLVKNHYIFNVESAGAIAPETLVEEAIKVLEEKCRFFLSELKALKV